MSNMKTVDARGLQHHLGRYLDEVERGETLEVRRRRRVIARIGPYGDDEPEAPWPDLVARLEALYPDGPVAASASTQLYEDRGERIKR